MLTITVPAMTFLDEKTEEIIKIKEQTLVMEHSLVSLSKWESKWCKPFLSLKQGETLSEDEFLDYIRCMIVTPAKVDELTLMYLPNYIRKEIAEYINSPMTATWFSESKESKGKNKDTITNELIYYWMISLNIPFECQKWHLNRLMTLIRVCNIKNDPDGKKMSKKEIYAQNRELNKARRAKMGSKG